MKLKTWIYGLLLSLTGVISLMLVFAEPFYGMLPAALLCAATGGIFTAAYVMVRKKIIFWSVAAVMAAVFVYLMRYEIIGGYMQFYNLIMDRYCDYFKHAMYFAVPEGEYRLNGSIKLMLYFTATVLTCIYSAVVCSRKLTALPVTVNILLMIVPIAAGISVSPYFILMNIIFCIVMIIIAAGTGKYASGEKTAVYVYRTSIITGLAVYAAAAAVLTAVPEKTYKKPEFFNKVENYALSLYNGIRENLTERYVINNNRLGQTDEIIYDDAELLQVYSYEYSGRIYLRNFVGENFSTDTWYEPDAAEYSYSGENEEFRPQEAAANKFSRLLPDIYMYDMQVTRTGYDSKSALTTLYSYTGDSSLFKGEWGYEYIPDDMVFKYWNVTEQQILTAADSYLYTVYSYLWRDADRAYREYVYEHYLEVNTKCEETFRSLMSGMKKDTPDDVLKTAEFVRQHLAERCTYSLKPGKLPKGEELIDYFYNKNRYGYCTYFATTAVMMLRCAGIPARYVTGFAFDPDINVIRTEFVSGTKYSTVSVTDRSAHAWVEIYIDGLGWIQYEVTPGNFTEEEDEYDKPEETTAQPETTPEETDAETEPVTEKESIAETTADESETAAAAEEDEGQETHKFHLNRSTIKVILYMLGVAAVTMTVFFVLYVRYNARTIRYRRRYAEMKKNDFSGCVLMNYVLFEKINGLCGIYAEKYMTCDEYGKRIISESEYLTAEEVREFMEIYEKAVFAEAGTSMREVTRSEEILDKLRNGMYNDSGPLRKFKLRYLYMIFMQKEGLDR